MGNLKQSFEEIKQVISDFANTNHRDYIKAIISIEKGIDDEKVLDVMYENFMQNDACELLSDKIEMPEFAYELTEKAKKNVLAIQVGSSFAFLEKTDLRDIILSQTEYRLNIEGKENLLYTGKSYEDRLKIIDFSKQHELELEPIDEYLIRDFTEEELFVEEKRYDLEL